VEIKQLKPKVIFLLPVLVKAYVLMAWSAGCGAIGK
jgi:hypothetical protein